MNPEFAVDLLKGLMFVGMAIGLAVSLFQAVTTIQEQTLSFAPKALGIVGLLIVLLPWMIRTLIEFTTLIIQKLPEMAK
jgi:flagellar biosynthesis protein FliQ